MKLIIILSNHAYEDDLKKILKESGVLVFSSDRIEGFHLNGNKDLRDNWFGAGKQSEDSVMLFAFSDKEKIEQVFTAVEDYNAKDEVNSKVHAFMLNVEASV